MGSFDLFVFQSYSPLATPYSQLPAIIIIPAGRKCFIYHLTMDVKKDLAEGRENIYKLLKLTM